jgi:hypothetical protein
MKLQQKEFVTSVVFFFQISPIGNGYSIWKSPVFVLERKSRKSAVTIRRNYRRFYREKTPSVNSIKNWCEKFLKTDSVLHSKRSGVRQHQMILFSHFLWEIYERKNHWNNKLFRCSFINNRQICCSYTWFWVIIFYKVSRIFMDTLYFV